MKYNTGKIRKIKKRIMADPEMKKMLVRSAWDEIMLDLDGDGIADVCLSSDNVWGYIDTFSVDLTGNGEFNLYLHDANGNGLPDAILWGDDDSDELVLVAAGSAVENGLVETVAKIESLLRSDEFKSAELGLTLSDLADYLRSNAEALTESLTKKDGSGAP